MIRIAILIAALVLTWLVWSGLYKPLLLILGMVSIALVVVLSARMDLLDRRVFALDLTPRLLGFWAWLLREIVLSNITVARIVLSPSLPISPTVIRIKPPLKGEIGQATLANCITLTPGTLTVDALDGVFLVHSLTEEGASEVKQGEMGQRLVRALGER